MYKKIMAPVDLTHIDKMGKAIETATILAARFNAPVTFVGVTASTPTPVAHNPHEYQEKLDAFAAEQAKKHGIVCDAKGYTAHDPAVQIDKALLSAVHDTGADLVVMASHIPNIVDAVWPSHGGSMASHADVSVFLVR